MTMKPANVRAATREELRTLPCTVQRIHLDIGQPRSEQCPLCGHMFSALDCYHVRLNDEAVASHPFDERVCISCGDELAR
jgi:hypothetical protein